MEVGYSLSFSVMTDGLMRSMQRARGVRVRRAYATRCREFKHIKFRMFPLLFWLRNSLTYFRY